MPKNIPVASSKDGLALALYALKAIACFATATCAPNIFNLFHRCPLWQDADAYDPAAQEAEGRELTKAARSSVMGGMNYHIEVRFDDGIIWIALIRRFNATSPLAALRDYIIQSEVATLMFLGQTGVPAPKVYDFALEHPGNPVGVGFILMEKLPGKSLRWSLATQQQRKKVMSQLADTFVELQKYPFHLLGSLDSPAASHVGAFARESLTDLPQSEMHIAGPFSSLEDYHMSSLRLTLDLIVREEMYSQQAVDAYLIHRFLMDLVPRVLPPVRHDEKF
ncbi:hypothetical protein HYQ46_000004 [Verticillium longisporum]|nr:hypothetical protein HYQ46_000004 [Verticillium longisporum]